MDNFFIAHSPTDSTPTFFTVKFDEYSTSKDNLDNTGQLIYLIFRSPLGHGLTLITLELFAFEL